MNHLTRTFINGLLAILPIGLTIFILHWIIMALEGIFRPLILFIMPEDYYHTGMGILFGIVVIFLTGVFIQTWGLRKLYEWGESTIVKFPLIGDIYSSIKDLFEYFSSSKSQAPDKVVVVEYNGIRLLGLLIREDFTTAPKGIAEEDMVSVYLPMSYQIGGYTVYIPKKYVTAVDMTRKEAIKWTLTAGMMSEK